MDDGALNYNPSATYDGGSYCIYEHQVGCTDYNAYNYNGGGTMYDDCSCVIIDDSNFNWVESEYSWCASDIYNFNFLHYLYSRKIFLRHPK